MALNRMTITVGSVTYAHKAKRILEHARISSRVVKIDASKSRNGCTHGLEFAREDFLGVVMELKKEGINYTVYSG